MSEEVDGLLAYQRKTSAAKSPRSRAAARLVLDGWAEKERCGKLIWSHETITKGFYVLEEIAVERNEQEGSR